MTKETYLEQCSSRFSDPQLFKQKLYLFKYPPTLHEGSCCWKKCTKFDATERYVNFSTSSLFSVSIPPGSLARREEHQEEGGFADSITSLLKYASKCWLLDSGKMVLDKYAKKTLNDGFVGG